MAQSKEDIAPTPAKPRPIKTTSWSDAEKIAFLVSIITCAGGKPKWSDVSYPAGRTVQGSQKMYAELLKHAADVEMTSGKNVTPSKKRSSAAAAGSGPKEGVDTATGSPRAKKAKTAGVSAADGGATKKGNGKGKGGSQRTNKEKKQNMMDNLENDNDDDNEGGDAMQESQFQPQLEQEQEEEQLMEMQFDAKSRNNSDDGDEEDNGEGDNDEDDPTTPLKKQKTTTTMMIKEEHISDDNEGGELADGV